MQSRSSRKVDSERPLLPLYLLVFAVCMFLLWFVAGCAAPRLNSGDAPSRGFTAFGDRIDGVMQYVAELAPEGAENAIDGWRLITIKGVGKWRVDFLGLYKTGDVVRARSFAIEGMWTRYDGAPFAWRLGGEPAH